MISDKTNFTILIVDDEPLARQGLRDAVGRAGVPGAEVVALCENAFTALAEIRRAPPDILFLDIVMPVLDGFAMLEQLEPEATPAAVIFVTAHDEHALRAFDAAAIDYLVKPVSDARLRAALDRAVRRVGQARATNAMLGADHPNTVTGRPPYLTHLVVPDRDRQIIVPVQDIEWIEGDTYYVRVHAQGRVRLLRERLSRLETALDPRHFHRTHRSAIVRLDLIREVRADSPYTRTALLATGARVPVSRERAKSLEAALGLPVVR